MANLPQHQSWFNNWGHDLVELGIATKSDNG